jgi:hypothetical protein
MEETKQVAHVAKPLWLEQQSLLPKSLVWGACASNPTITPRARSEGISVL